VIVSDGKYEVGGRWIRYRGSGLRFVSRFCGNGRFLFLHENTGFPLSRLCRNYIKTCFILSLDMLQCNR